MDDDEYGVIQLDDDSRKSKAVENAEEQEDLELTDEEKEYWEQLKNEEVSLFFYRPGQTKLTVRLQKEVIKAMKFLDEQDKSRK